MAFLFVIRKVWQDFRIAGTILKVDLVTHIHAAGNGGKAYRAVKD